MILVIGFVVIFFTLLFIETKLNKMIGQNEQIIELLSKSVARSGASE